MNFLENIFYQIIEWIVFHSMELILIGVLLSLWKLFWEMS